MGNLGVNVTAQAEKGPLGERLPRRRLALHHAAQGSSFLRKAARSRARLLHTRPKKILKPPTINFSYFNVKMVLTMFRTNHFKAIIIIYAILISKLCPDISQYLYIDINAYNLHVYF